MNLPNKLTIVRILMVPLFLFFGLFRFPGEYGEVISRIVAALIFAAAAITDFADGKIARKYHLITDFGKFMDPLADKFLVFSAILVFVSSPMYTGNAALHIALVISGAIVIFRELAITSLRLVVMGSPKPVVIAASWYGKAKTFSQCIWAMVVMLEPVLFPFIPGSILTWISTVVMALLTIISGYDYIKSYWSYLDPTK
ncbi:MAG: CDP-diacylglycerol--glycerol-3-phosphate 3-phosphatidyltransferase [Clostridia bacterium]|nr:CDP-diacylglycerol--glycerol-3-phosphate 3-phosphatidyltransferase [Clostridia bacterium]